MNNMIFEKYTLILSCIKKYSINCKILLFFVYIDQTGSNFDFRDYVALPQINSKTA